MMKEGHRRRDTEKTCAQILCVIAQLSARNNRALTLDEIVEGVSAVDGIRSRSGVHHQIGALRADELVAYRQPSPPQKKGYCLTESGLLAVRGMNQDDGWESTPGGVEVQPWPSRQGLRLMIVAATAAGSGIEAVEDAEPFDVVPQGTTFFALRVIGDSMIDDHIHHGDFVLVVPADEVQISNGDIVLALLTGRNRPEAGETTVKRLYRDAPNRIRLQPSNPDMQPIFESPENVRVQGKVFSAIRTFR